MVMTLLRRGALDRAASHSDYSPDVCRSLQSGLTIAPNLPHSLQRSRGPSEQHQHVIGPLTLA